MIIRKKVIRLKWVLGCSDYCQEVKTNKDQLTNIKNNKRIKAKVNITYTIDHYPKNR